MPSPYVRKFTQLEASQRNGRLGGQRPAGERALTPEEHLRLEQQAEMRGNTTKARYGKEFYRALAQKSARVRRMKRRVSQSEANS